MDLEDLPDIDIFIPSSSKTPKQDAVTPSSRLIKKKIKMEYFSEEKLNALINSSPFLELNKKKGEILNRTFDSNNIVLEDKKNNLNSDVIDNTCKTQKVTKLHFSDDEDLPDIGNIYVNNVQALSSLANNPGISKILQASNVQKASTSQTLPTFNSSDSNNKQKTSSNWKINNQSAISPDIWQRTISKSSNGIPYGMTSIPYSRSSRQKNNQWNTVRTSKSNKKQPLISNYGKFATKQPLIHDFVISKYSPKKTLEKYSKINQNFVSFNGRNNNVIDLTRESSAKPSTSSQINNAVVDLTNPLISEIKEIIDISDAPSSISEDISIIHAHKRVLFPPGVKCSPKKQMVKAFSSSSRSSMRTMSIKQKTEQFRILLKRIEMDVDIKSLQRHFMCPFHNLKRLKSCRNEYDLCQTCNWPINIELAFKHATVQGKMIRKWLTLSRRAYDEKKFIEETLLQLNLAENLWLRVEGYGRSFWDVSSDQVSLISIP